jgi:hypothetical protein
VLSPTLDDDPSLGERIEASLETVVAQHPDGEAGVLREWLTYCDALGPQIESVLAARAARGW